MFLAPFYFFVFDCRKVLEEQNQRNSNSKYFRIYILTLGIYAAVRVVFALLLKCKACHTLSEMSDQSFFQFFKWIYQVFFCLMSSCEDGQVFLIWISSICSYKFTYIFQERYYVGRGLFERFSDYCRFVLCLLELVFFYGCMLSWFLSLDFSNCYSIWSLDDSYSSVVSVDFSGDVCAVAFT